MQVYIRTDAGKNYLYDGDCMSKGKESKVNNGKKKKPFYERKSVDAICKAAGLLAGGFLIASLFFSWRMVIILADKRVYEGFSLFDVLRHAYSREFGGSFLAKSLVLLLFLLVIIAGVWMICFAFRDQIWPERYKKRQFFVDRFVGRFRLLSHLIPPAFGIVAVIILEMNAAYKVMFDKMSVVYNSWQGLMREGYHRWRAPGLGCWMFYSGVFLYFFAEVFRYLINTLNEED